ncbi:MAG TPA: SDR family NAD(P)-dependent oxidoreductase [Terriglobia bacterium]|nr:SDR family NAD(P)-dependent oxidoreductase [Terriglobia bacterium]
MPTDANKKTAAVTGAGGRLGRETALGLAAKGYRVFGTALKPDEIADLKQASGGAVALTISDITDETAVKSWAREVGAQTDGGLDLLIQNAGALTPGPLEVLSLEAMRHKFDVNPSSNRTFYVSNLWVSEPMGSPRRQAQKTCLTRDGRGRKGDRALGRVAGGWRPEQSRPMVRPERPRRQHERHVLNSEAPARVAPTGQTQGELA